MCAFPNKRGDSRTLSQKVEEDSVSEITPVEVRVTDTTRGFSCQECGGLTGYAVNLDGEPSVVSISEHPADRFHK
jgi:hypothetical protein